MDGTCSAHGRDEKYIQSFSQKTLNKELGKYRLMQFVFVTFLINSF
jgi:hypothetical protein